jgi:ketosteroid isomerase-like protein
MAGEDVEVAGTRPTPAPPGVVTFVSGLYQASEEGGVDAMVRDVWHRDIVWHDPPDFPDAAITRGAAAVAEHLRLRLEAIGRASVVVDDVWSLGDGDAVLVALSLSTGGKSSGVALPPVPLFQILRFEEGRLRDQGVPAARAGAGGRRRRVR